MRTIQQIELSIREFEDQFIPETIPAGTKDRKRLQAEAYREARARSCLPENVATRLAMHAELKKATTSARRASVAAAKKADPIHNARQVMFRELRRIGFSRESVSGKSAYYRCGDIKVRVSDHDVPMTAERSYNIANGGFSWANSGMSFVIGRDDASEFLRFVREAVDESK